MDKYKPIGRKFYLRDTVTVSKDLLGKLIVRKTKYETLIAKITESEAYRGSDDPASHSHRKITNRNKVMFDTGGRVYVYFIYGNYNCFNIVTEKKGTGSAVLIRAAEPVEGIEEMKSFRGKIKNIYELTNGPGKLCKALNIDKTFYGKDVTEEGEIFISYPQRKEKFEIVSTKRIGISKGADLPFRFFIKDNPFVTKHKFNNEIIIQ
ncbi:MAG: DNA-3-methyladenine glycosylase [Ignavibacteria bacterium]|nr:DNA-3-methyladenine glycosylase [Ignavibacteria bacterium]